MHPSRGSGDQPGRVTGHREDRALSLEAHAPAWPFYRGDSTGWAAGRCRPDAITWGLMGSGCILVGLVALWPYCVQLHMFCAHKGEARAYTQGNSASSSAAEL
mgnify:CR=1 FL=1